MIFPSYNPDPSSIAVSIDLFLFGLIFLFMITNFFSMLLIRIIVMPKFDKEFGDILSLRYDRLPTSRCYWYAVGISSPIGLKRKNGLYSKVFGQYDFKLQASRFEWIICCVYMISIYVVVLLILLFGLHYLIYCTHYWIYGK